MTLDAAYFERVWASSPDPWRFETRWYERRKRALTMACLPEWHYGSAFEPGCATGLLTAALAERCDGVLATDVSDRPLRTARDRLRGRSGVRLRTMAVPAEWPEGETFDLIVLSEVGYYCGGAALGRLATRVASSLTSEGTLLACHWRHPVADHPSGAEEVHGTLASTVGATRVVRHEEDDFLLDVWSRRQPASVAAQAGLAP